MRGSKSISGVETLGLVVINPGVIAAKYNKAVSSNAKARCPEYRTASLLVQGRNGRAKPMISKFLKSGISVRPSVRLVLLAALASTVWTPVTWAAEFPAIIPLSSLEGYIGFRLDGSMRFRPT